MRASLISRLEALEKSAKHSTEAQKREQEYLKYCFPRNHLDAYKARYDRVWECNKSQPITIPSLTLPSGFLVDDPLIAVIRLKVLEIHYSPFFDRNLLGVLYREYTAELIEAIEPFFNIQPSERIPEPITDPVYKLSWAWEQAHELRPRFLKVWATRNSGDGSHDTSYPDENGFPNNNRMSVACRIHDKLNLYLIKSAVYMMVRGSCYMLEFIQAIERDGWWRAYKVD